jgi:formamidopyrimidine-DNA glycosylase
VPEGPEAEITRRQLTRWTVGQRVVDITLFDPAVLRVKCSTSPKFAQPDSLIWLRSHLLGHAPTAVLRHGKRLGWCWEKTGLLLHLGMTGQWGLGESYLTHNATRIAFRMANNTWVGFVDTRRFGCLVPQTAPIKSQISQNLGPDSLDTRFTGPELAACFGGRRPLKVALMDQRCVAGVGNIHAVELLWRAHIHPATPVNRVTDRQWAHLAGLMADYMRGVVSEQGEGEMRYITQGGDNPFSVYGRDGHPCSRCSGIIENKKIQGRSTFYCTSCQQL